MVKNMPAKREFAPWVGKIPGVGNGNSFQYPCLESAMERGAWWAPVHGVQRVGTTEQLRTTL